MQPKLMVRDSSLWLAMFGLLWAEQRALATVGAGPLASGLGVAAALLVGLCGHYLHELGHLVAALGTRSVVRYPDRLSAPLLFDFDVERNSAGQFLAMSYGGYAGSLLGIVLIVSCLPLTRVSGQLSLALALLGALASLVLEGPTTWRVMRGGTPPAALVHVASPTREGTEGTEGT